MMSLTAFALGLLAAHSGCPKAAPGGEIEIRVRTSAMVRGTDVRIGELCEITPINSDTVQIADLVFAPTPASGRARRVTRTEIVQSLAAAGYDVGLFTFSGPSQIVVQPVRGEIDGVELLEVATASLRALLAVEGGDVEIEPPSHIRRYKAPPGRIGRKLDARVRGGRTGTSSAVVDVDVLVDGKSYRRIPVMFKLQRFHMLLKTRGPIEAGARLGAHNLELVREPLAQATGLYITDMKQVVGMEAARRLQSNSRITLGDIAPPALVHSGDVVTVVLNRGRVKVTARAMVTQDAPLGGRVTLTNMKSRATMTGVVAAPGLVVIQ